ncbi:MAG: OmpA family protein [Saprospiraceae bacterium]|nr:OmpA family protein [Saprospiraceae bacterium]
MKRINGIVLVFLGILTACSYTEKIKDGKTAFERKRYFQAAEMLLDEYQGARSNIERGNIAFLLGESHSRFNDVSGATKWYKTAYDLGYGTNALVQYAHTLKKSEQYEQAANAYYLASDEIQDHVRFRKEISYCVQAINWSEAARYRPYRVQGLAINTEHSDYAPSVTGASKVLFTSDREPSAGEQLYAWTGNKFSDIYQADLASEEVTPLEDRINTEDNEGTAVVSPDGETMLLCRCFSRSDYDSHCKLMSSERDARGWTEPKVLPFVQDGINYRQPTFTADSSVLIFSANIEESLRKYDLYMVRMDAEGEWGTPESLGNRINTEFNEVFPSVHADTLYFSSDKGGMGGLDIYKTWLRDDGSWAPTQNLMAPINSGADDFGFVINTFATPTDSVIQSGYFTSSREGGKGFDDLYLFEKLRYVEQPPVEVEEFVYEIQLDLRVNVRQYEDPEDPNSRVIMRVPLINADILVEEDGNPIQEADTDRFGMLRIKLAPNKTYTFKVSNDGYFNNELDFVTIDLPIDSTVRLQQFEESLLLDKIFYDKEIVLENIYYDLDKDFIREDAKPTLNELANLLKLNPELAIQLAAHTDCQAGDDYNLDLSQRRAQSAVTYLIEQGINGERLTPKGFGESRLAVECICTECTEEQHQANRRTTFTVQKSD